MANVYNMINKLIAICILLLASTNSVRAALIVEVKDTQVVVDDIGYIEVLIYSTDTDNLSIFGYDFRITTNAVNSKLTFLGTADLSQEDIGNYVFPSDAQAFSNVMSIVLDSDQIAGGDSNLDESSNFQDVVVTTEAKTLVKLIVKHETLTVPAEAAIGDEFVVTLWNEANEPEDLLDDTTYFANFANSELAASPLSPLSSLSGKITIVATPEPSTYLLLSSAAATFWCSRRFRRPTSPKSPRV